MSGHFPGTIRAGVTFDLTVKLDRYPAPAWALQVLLRGAHGIDFTSNPLDNGYHQLLVDATTTAAWVPGQYLFSIRAVSSGTVVEVESGIVTMEADLSTIADGTDARIHAQRVLDAIQAVIEKRATQDQERYTINSRELHRTPIGDLLKLRDYYKAELRRLKAVQRGTLFGRQVKVTF
ncbi:hypothetical protein [Paraburkholderia sp. J12]|uniref:hypothetical protein n=1 Tax=Paraburkholderia sp. J12 TaxID=2805432 RepID=UPI002ABD3BDE|nr:hypothetical protein [Paraburkholderia sp. J12]